MKKQGIQDIHMKAQKIEKYELSILNSVTVN